MDIVSTIKKAIKEVLTRNDIASEDIEISHPAFESHGDYSTNVAMTTFVKLKAQNSNVKTSSKLKIQDLKSPREVSQIIVEQLKKNGEIRKLISKIEIAGPGFINFRIAEKELMNSMERDAATEKPIALAEFKGKKVMVEFAHPNTHKAFHIGHLRNISIGEAITRMLEYIGYEVIRTNYQGDVGIHIAKCLWAIVKDEKFNLAGSKMWSLEERAKYMGQAYVIGSKAYDDNETANQEIKDINYLIYASAQEYQKKVHGIKPGSTDYMKFITSKKFSLGKISELWIETRQWSLDYFEKIYKRVHSLFDRCYFESQCLSGVDTSYEALKKGILKKSEGAVVFDGKPYGLDTRVFINSLGLPTYEGKELGLAPMEFHDFGELTKIIHVVTPEQTSFFKITFKVEELLGIQHNQQYHLSYGWVRLKAGKMSSREGNVILGEWLLDEAKQRIKKVYPHIDESTAEAICIGAVKYSFLKYSVEKDIAFDIDESISLEGNSGPYLQYAYARAKSVLRKVQNLNSTLPITDYQLQIQNEELSLLRALHRFPEIVLEAGKSLAPNLICNYLFDLAQKFNLFYQKIPILNAKEEEKRFRLLLTQAVAHALKNGLYLLGIEVLEKM